MAAPTIDDLVKTLLDLYTGVEQRLARDIATTLKAGIDSPDWAQQKLTQLGQLRQRTERVLARLAAMSDDRARQAIALAAQRGGQQALRELHIQAQAPLPDLAGVVDALPGIGALVRLARELALTLRSTHAQILRWTLDSYRDVVARAALPEILLGVQTRRQAAQHAWQGLVDRGITGFTDRAGRRWELASYVEMAVRTGAHQAMRQGHMDRLTDAGEDLVIVSDSPRECGLCRPWERRILSLSGRAGRVLVEDELVDDRIIAVNAVPIQVAQAAGLFHPNCTHSTSLYLPGVTKVGNATSDPDGYEAKQRQRAIERHIRRWKKRSIAAIDPVAKRRADVKVREWQAALRQHIDQHGLKRLRYREQVGAGNIPPAAPTPTPAGRRLTPDQARTMQQRMLANQPWTDEQRDAIERYASGWAPDINRPLRTGKKPSSPAAAKAIRDLQAAMRPLSQPVRAFRYVLPDAFGPGVRASDLASMVGKTVQDRGFTSTTIAPDGHPDEGLARAARVLPVRIELDVPAGHPAAYVEELSANPGQWELLLGAGTKLQIVEVHQDGAQTVVRVRVVP